MIHLGGIYLIKGCAKRVVVVRDINNSFFEEAFFIVKAGAGKQNATKENDYINEAHRIVRSDLPQTAISVSSASQNPYIPTFSIAGNSKKGVNKMRDVLMFMLGFVVSAGICTLIYYSGSVL